MNTPRIQDFAGKRIHMIGIGGSSMSGLAQMLLYLGYQVTGSDQTDGYLVPDVRAAGIPVAIGHAAENVHGADLIVYTAAIKDDNPELMEAAHLGIPTMERAELLGQLMAHYARAVGISGAHGKTTATAMLAEILLEGDCDPSVSIGGKLDAIGGSVRVGHSDIFVAEACEYNRSFLHMHPALAVVLNIDADHLDCYKDIDEIEQTFGQFLHLLPENGIAIGNGTDERVMRQLKTLSCRTITFGLTENCDVHPVNLKKDEESYPMFDLCIQGQIVAHVHLNVLGNFNVENALAALAAAWALGADMQKAAESLHRFKGAHRRFEKTGMLNGAEMYHDYGHNPTEMRNTVSVAREHAKGKVYAVMQPHTYARVTTLYDAYLTCTEEADVTVVMDIFCARERREDYPADLNSGKLVEGMRAHGLNAVWTPSFDDTEKYLREHLQPGDLAVTMGCGNVNELNDQIEKHEKQHQ